MAGAPPPPRRDSPPVLPDELVEEILLRLPPDEPAWLLRASLVCKSWGQAVYHRSFRRRLHELHGTPPLLGFLHNWAWERIPCFVPTTASSFSLAAAPDCRSWRALDHRHGRALFLSEGQGQGRAQELLVWEPITGAQRRVPVPSLFETVRGIRNAWYGSVREIYPGATVFCAAEGCDHRDCHGDPFGLVFVFTNLELADPFDDAYTEFDISACVFSSETGTWGKLTSMKRRSMEFIAHSSVLVGRSLLYFMSDEFEILEYDLARHSITVLHPPSYSPSYVGRFKMMLTEDGSLGVGEYSDPNLKLWTREASDGTDAQWVLSRVINLDNFLPIATLMNADSRVQLLGFAEGANVVFCNTIAGIFTVELQSEKAMKVCDNHGFCNLIPVVSFYTPVPRGEHQDPPLLGPSEEAGGEEEKAVEQRQQLFDKGSNAIDEEEFVNACFSHTLETRVPSHGEVALECASTEYGCAFLYKAQAMNDPLEYVSKSASNEESVMGTTSKHDAGNSKTSGSNVEDVAPPSQKGESNEVLR